MSKAVCAVLLVVLAVAGVAQANNSLKVYSISNNELTGEGLTFLSFADDLKFSANGKTVGKSSGTCTKLPGTTALHCEVVHNLPKGMISLVIPFSQTTKSEGVITGGTGAYKGVSGSVISKSPKAGLYVYEFKF